MPARRRGFPTRRQARQTRGQARKIEQRLDRVKRARVERSRSPLRDHNPKKSTRVGTRRALLFGLPLFAGVLLASTSVEGARAWWNGSPADVASISVLGNSRLSAAEVAAATGLVRGAPLQGLSEREIEERVAVHPWIDEVRVALLPTGTIVVEVEERTARAVVRAADREGEPALYVIDDDCAPFLRLVPGVKSGFEDLPRIAARPGDPMQRPRASVCVALALAESVRARGGANESTPTLSAFEVVLPADASPEGWVLREPAGHEVLLGHGSEAELDDRLERLGRLFAANPAQLDQASTIDLRFAEQAVLRSFRASR